MSGHRPDNGCIEPDTGCITAVWIPKTPLALKLSETLSVCDVKYTGNDSSCSSGKEKYRSLRDSGDAP